SRGHPQAGGLAVRDLRVSLQPGVEDHLQLPPARRLALNLTAPPRRTSEPSLLPPLRGYAWLKLVDGRRRVSHVDPLTSLSCSVGSLGVRWRGGARSNQIGGKLDEEAPD